MKDVPNSVDGRSPSEIKASQKSPTETIIDDLLAGKITQAEYGVLVRAEVEASTQALLKSSSNRRL